MTFNLYENLLNQINSQSIILTPNRRLSAVLHQLYQQKMLNAKQLTWETPTILPFITWIELLWQQYSQQHFEDLPYLLLNSHSHFLWEKIVAATSSDYLLQVSTTAETAYRAYGLLKEWQIKLQQNQFSGSEDYEVFYQWLMEYEQVCRDNNWLDRHDLLNFLQKKILKQQLPLPKKIWLVGFNEPSPQLEIFLNTLKQNYLAIEFYQEKVPKNQVYRLSLADEETELYMMARFAKQKYISNPQHTVGCVIPNLEKNLSRVKQIFNHVFQQDNAFNISAGKILSEYLVIEAALLILNFDSVLNFEQLSFLIHTPFIGHAEQERLDRAALEVELRQKNINSIDIFSTLAKTILARFTPLLAARLNVFLNKKNEIQFKKLYPNEWAIEFVELLKLIGWPGERSLNSEEYQVVQSWLQVFSEYEILTTLCDKMSYQKALATLMAQTRSKIFQPQSPQSNIQILGILEAAGIPFDYLWIAGLDNMAWPPAANPNPFIPKKLQREYNMPHSTSQRELEYCTGLLEQLCNGANELIFSYPQTKQDMSCQPSALIENFPEVNLTSVIHEEKSPALLNHELEKFVDQTAPALTTTAIKGGVHILKSQALCPFKAFAEWRLHAKPLEKISLGLRPKDKGIVVHKILELFWQEVKNQARLIEFTQKELLTLIDTFIDQAFISLYPTYQKQSTYLALEKKRLSYLLADWFALEKERQPFTVLANEAAQQITLNQLTLSLKIDRIDQLENGKHLVIDYKTSKYNDINKWFSARIDEPQLPLYALLQPEKTIGISYAQISPNQLKFKGVSNSDLKVPGIKHIIEIKKIDLENQPLDHPWQNQLGVWRSDLISLSDEFVQGVASVTPKESTKTCATCSLSALCRINADYL